MLDIRRRALGEEHPAIAMTLAQLGGVLRERGDPAGAEALLLRSFRMRRRLLGDAHPHVSESAGQLVSLYEETGRPAQARAYRVFVRDTAFTAN